MNAQAERVCCWAGIVCIPLFFAGWWFGAGFMPPVPPSWNAEQVAEHYQSNSTGVKIFAVILMYCCALLALFYAAISAQLRRIEGQFGIFSIAQVTTGVLSASIFIPTTVTLAVMTFRKDLNPELIYLFSDFTWIMFIILGAPLVTQLSIVGFAILTDPHEQPILPRWLGFTSIWGAVLSVPGLLIVFFHTGPFAWNGIFGFWIPAGVFGMWTILVAVELLKAISREEQLMKMAE